MSEDQMYYLTMFKLEGHKTWRVDIKRDAGGFDREWKKVKNAPKVTEKKIIRINKITGELDIKV